MRTLSVLAVLACVLALSACVARADSAAVADADDAALMELGIDLSHASASTLKPTPTYVTSPPAGHDAPTMAKFPLMHEIEGVEARDWKEIQGVLFREPLVASETNLDLKLDELEKKFDAMETMPVPSPIAPPGSTLLPPKVKNTQGLFATLNSGAPRMAQKPAADKAKGGAAPKPSPSKPRKAKGGAAPKPSPSKPRRAKGTAAPKPAPFPKVAAPSLAAVAAKPTAAAAADAASTVKLIEKRIRGLSILFQRLKSTIGISAAGQAPAVAPLALARVGAAPAAAAAAAAPTDAAAAAARVDAALLKHRKKAADLKKRMAAKKTRFVQLGLDLDADLDAESEAEAQANFEAEQEAMAETDSFAELGATVDSESELDAELGVDIDAELESEAEADAELSLDAEAVDQILETLM